MAKMGGGEMVSEAEHPGSMKSSNSRLVAHGGHSYHVEHGEHGMERTEHKSLPSALAQMAKLHGEGPVMVIGANDDGYDAHGMTDEGKMSVKQHGTMSQLKKHVGEVMGVG